MRPKLLLIQTRPEDITSDDEYRSFLYFCGLEPAQLVRKRLDKSDYSEINLADYDGLIMAGGPANFAYPEDQKSAEQKTMERWTINLLKEIIAQDKPFLGVCLGMSALATSVNNKPDFNYSEQVGMANVSVTMAGVVDLLLQGMPTIFQAVSGHKEGCPPAMQGVEVLATSAACAQIVRVGSSVYGVQYHPEIDLEGITTRLGIYRNDGYCPPEEVESIIQGINWQKVEDSHVLLKNFIDICQKAWT